MKSILKAIIHRHHCCCDEAQGLLFFGSLITILIVQEELCTSLNIQGQSDTKIVISLFLVAKVIYSYSNKDKFNGFLKEELLRAIENATRLGHKKSD